MTMTPPGWYPNPQSPGTQSYWDGAQWIAQPQQPQQVVVAKNGFATLALVLGICGFFLMGIPFFIGWVLGGIPDLLAIVFGIIGLLRSTQLRGVGKVASIVAIVLASVSLLSVFIGAGSIW